MPSEKLPADDQSAEDWFEDQLRRVPVPDGLLKRLRKVAVASDDQLDAALRDVSLPPGLEFTLAEVAADRDPVLDRAVADVPANPGLLDQLRAIPQYTDPHMEALLRDVPVPQHLLGQLATIPVAMVEPSPTREPAIRRRRGRRWLQLATAASLLFTISLSYLAAIGSIVATAYRTPPQDALAIAWREAPLAREGEIGERRDLKVSHTPPVKAIAQERLPVEPLRLEWPEWLEEINLTAHAYEIAWQLRRRFKEVSLRRPGDDVSQEPAPLLANRVPQDTIALQQIDDIPRRGITPPLFDPELLLFQMTKGVHPFQDPSAHKPLETSAVPLVATTASYDWAARLVADMAASGAKDRRSLETALARHVRTEEFLAAIDYRVAPADDGTLALRAFGGPSPWGAPGYQMLQVVATAGQHTGPVGPAEQPIATSARLTVKFDPQTVAAYRLLGHEATSTVGLLDVPVEVDLQPGQTCVGLFELQWKSSNRNRVGWATLTWYDVDGQHREVRQPISRLQFASTFEESALSLQAAVVVAGTAELMRGSPFVTRPASSLQAVRNMADRVDPILQAQPSFRGFVTFLETAMRAGLR